MKAMLLDTVSSPTASPICPPTVAGTDGGLLAPELAAGIGRSQAPAGLHSYGPSPFEAAARAMGRVEGRGAVVHRGRRTTAGTGGVSPTACPSSASNARRSGVVIASSGVRPRDG